MEATVGIDIAKLTFSICVLCEDRSEENAFSNDKAGFRKLNAWLRHLKVAGARVCMESTNSYWEALAEFLYGKSYRVSVVNAYRTNAYWKSEHLRAKTDRIDAAMLARFCNAQDPELWRPPSQQLRQLRELVRELEYLKAERTRLRVRLEHGDGYCLRRVMINISSEIKKLENHVIRSVRKDPVLAKRFKNLQTIPGIGKVTALIMLCEIGDKVNVLDRDELVAYAGLAPRIFESGTSIRKSRGTANPGNHRVKRAFYLPATTAVRCSPLWEAYLNRFIERGKPWKVAIGAIMRKLFIIACGVLKSNTAYDASLRPQPA